MAFRSPASTSRRTDYWADVEGAGGVSPADVPADFRAREADYAQSWFATITAEVFG